ncbi:hypothetical protein ACFYNM_06840 [Streptomyces spororaveus]|uniref:hypothetical protein n=1 Tax=Streptomyces spororaveus TaxID=284039 RepID=UPI00369E4F44
MTAGTATIGTVYRVCTRQKRGAKYGSGTYEGLKGAAHFEPVAGKAGQSNLTFH